jgi:hypothetical protein
MKKSLKRTNQKEKNLINKKIYETNVQIIKEIIITCYINLVVVVIVFPYLPYMFSF